jgi:hypothetical protein
MTGRLMRPMAALVVISCSYLGDPYPGDVGSGALAGIDLAEIVRQVRRAVVRVAGSDIGTLDWEWPMMSGHGLAAIIVELRACSCW